MGWIKRDNVAETPLYGRAEFQTPAPKTSIPKGSMTPESAYQLINDELNLDGSTALNLATFVNTWMDEWATKLALENINKNFIDHEEYPQSNLVEKRIIWMLGNWYGTKFDCQDTDPDSAKGFYGSATIGSSEAIMLGLIAHRKAWQKNNAKNPNRCALDKPFILMSTHVHTCWDKYCKYFDVGALYIEPKEENNYGITGDQVKALLNTHIGEYQPINKNDPTIQEFCEYSKDYPGLKTRTVGELVMAVGCVVGTTFTGNSDDVKGADRAISDYCKQHKQHKQHEGLSLDIPIHVDAASGGFILPFTNTGTGDVPFDFKSVERVRSINVSNHKFGLTYPGMGSVVFRNSSVVDKSLIYTITYLGGHFYDYTVNFSRGTSMILMQYYNFLRLGLKGYRDIQVANVARANQFVEDIEKSNTLKGLFTPISDLKHYPIIVLKWASTPPSCWSMKKLSDGLRKFGWIVPAYKLPTNDPECPDGLNVLRVVVRQNISADKLAELLTDMETVVKSLKKGTRLERPIQHGSRC